jgi:predicted lipid-binding transport protein (Tim44 family)
MGMFTDLMHKIFRPATAAPAEAAPQPTERGTSGGGSPAAAQPAAPVDVAAILDTMASESKQKLDWRHSIVDLMKLVGMDSSLNARRELAADLNYSGDTGDTATMNMWLHKEVMKKLAANEGKVPPDLLAA